MPRKSLGELEHMILLAILRLGAGAYGAAIIEEIETRTDREASHAAAYIALQRLEAKSWVEAKTAKGTTERGGRAKATYTVTEVGRERLRESASALFAMWEGVDSALRGEGGA